LNVISDVAQRYAEWPVTVLMMLDSWHAADARYKR
jgi:hypothetical protein